MSKTSLDAVVVGAGPNGLAAAVELAREGFSVRVVEARDEVGGGARSGEATLPGFLHDHCSAIHPLGVLSPYLRTLPLAEHGLEWCSSPVSVAHPLDDGSAPVLTRELPESGSVLGEDADRWRALFAPWLRDPHTLLADVLGPLRPVPRGPLAMARFGWFGLRAATSLAGRFRGDAARALLAGCAAHSVLPLEMRGTAAVGLLFALTAQVTDWPCAKGGSRAIANALASLLEEHGGAVELGREARDLSDLPPSRVVLFDLTPKPLLKLTGDALPANYTRKLERFRYGPGTFKLDWALDGPIPWRNPEVARASTVHVGGTLEEVAASERAAWRGEHHERPFLILCQQSALDPTRAPEGRHTGYAYCHVPHGSTLDRTEVIEAQVERFAPGFRERILARRATAPADFEASNPNLVGGSITGGSSDLRQLFTRPVARLDPYSTPNPHLFLCSSSSPPGGGVHGMCGYHAARSAVKRLRSGRV